MLMSCRQVFTPLRRCIVKFNFKKAPRTRRSIHGRIFAYASGETMPFLRQNVYHQAKRPPNVALQPPILALILV